MTSDILSPFSHSVGEIFFETAGISDGALEGKAGDPDADPSGMSGKDPSGKIVTRKGSRRQESPRIWGHLHRSLPAWYQHRSLVPGHPPDRSVRKRPSSRSFPQASATSVSDPEPWILTSACRQPLRIPSGRSRSRRRRLRSHRCG